MHARAEGAKCCHLIWMTHDGRSCFKIAAAARFCEHAVRHACTSLGWRLDLVAVLPDRVHLLVMVPAREDRRTVSTRLRQATTRLLADANLVPREAGTMWEHEWCAVLPSAVAAVAVRRVLCERKGHYAAGRDGSA
jgi:REP element-mobilizing transposase RayT